MALTLTRDFGVNLLLQAMVVAPALLLVSTVYFVLIERPCMERDWPQRLARRVAAVRQRTFPRRLPGLVPLETDRSSKAESSGKA